MSFLCDGSTPKFLVNNGTEETPWPVYDMTSEQYVLYKAPMSADSVKERLLPERTSLYTAILPPFLDSLKTPSDGGSGSGKSGGGSKHCDGKIIVTFDDIESNQLCLTIYLSLNG